MEKNIHGRFKDAPWYPSNESEAPMVMIGGAGGIGSWTAFLLARAGFKPVIYDFDTLEEHNIGGQLYSTEHIGIQKVEALQETIKSFCDHEPMIFNQKIDHISPTHYYVISAFDNMQARKDMFNTWCRDCSDIKKAIFIDGRLTAEQLQIFCIKSSNPEDVARYKNEYLFSDEEVEDAPCTMKQTSHAAAMIASHIVGFFTNHITNVVENDTTRTVPFMWEYYIPIDLISVT